MHLKSVGHKISFVYPVIIVIFLISFFGIQITYTITLNNFVLKSEAENLFRKYSINTNALKYYPTGYSLVVPIRNSKSLSNETLLHGLTDQLRELDTKTYGDNFIVSGSGNRGDGIFEVRGNDRGTPEMIIALIKQIPQFDAMSIRIEYPQKIFYTYGPFISGIFTLNRMRHDPRITNIETGVTSLPVILLNQRFVK